MMIKVLVDGEWIGPNPSHTNAVTANKVVALDDATAQRVLARAFLALAFLFMLIAIYGSIVPLAFEPNSLATATTRFFKVLNGPVHFGSKSDWLSNILLFMPIGFCWCAALRIGIKPHRTFHLMWILPLCVGLSLFVEFLQIWFPPRHPSINDMVAESLGALTGIMTWFILGIPLFRNYLRWQKQSRVRAICGLLLAVDAMVLLVMHAMPLDLSISPGELNQKWKAGLIHPIPFTAERIQEASFWVKSAWNVLYFASIGLLLPGIFRRKNWFLCSFIGLGLVAGIEALQLITLSRNCDSSDLMTGMIGIWLGVAACESKQHYLQVKRWFPLLWLALLTGIWLTPFSWATEEWSSRLAQANWAPFLDYQSQHYLYAFDEILQRLLVFSIFCAICMLGWRIPAWQAVFLTIVVATTLEITQLFMDGRIFSTTDPTLAAFGARFGMMVARLIGPKAESSRS